MDKDVLNKAPLLEAFKDVIQNKKLEEAFARACITDLCYYKSDKKMELNIECCDCVNPAQIKGLEKAISDSLNIKVKVRPGFNTPLKDELEDWQKELLLAKVKSVKKHFLHFIEDAEINLSGSYLNVILKNQSSSILIAAGVGNCIEKAMLDLFGKVATVKFIDSEQCEKLVDYLEKKQEEEARIVSEMMSSISEDASKLAKEKTQNTPEPIKQTGAVKYGSRKTRSSNKDPNLIYGRGIKGSVIKMSQVDTNSGMVTIQGQILKAEKRSLKSGRFFTRLI